MSYIELLLMYEAINAIENIDRSRIERIDIDVETMGRIVYTNDGKCYVVTVEEVSQE